MKVKVVILADTRVGEGIWVGIREKSGESIIGTEKGVVKARTVRRKSVEDRWKAYAIKEVVATPEKPSIAERCQRRGREPEAREERGAAEVGFRDSSIVEMKQPETDTIQSLQTSHLSFR